MSSEYIFSMYKVSRTHPPDKQVLADISLSFFPGAKIGVLGYNGAGKSTLLRIMAGIDTEYRGEASSTEAPRSECSSRSPRWTSPRTCAATSRTASREARDLLDRYNEVAANYSDETADEFARLQDQIEAADAWNLDTRARDGDGRAPPPARRRRRDHALGRRAAPRRAVPPAAERAGPAAAGRAHQPPGRRVRRLARAPPRGVQGHDRRRDPRPLLPRQRRRLDPRARPRPRHPLQGQLLRLARAEAGAARAGEAQGHRAGADHRRRARVGAREPQGTAQEVEGPPRPLRGAARRGPGK